MKTLITYNRSNIMTLAWDFITVLGMDKARAMHRAWSIARQQREDFLVTGEVRVVNAYTPCCIMVCEDDVAGLVAAHVEAAIAWDKEHLNLDLVVQLNAKLNDSRLDAYIQQQGVAA